MSQEFDNLKKILRKLPSLGPKAAERIALNLVLENPSLAKDLQDCLAKAQEAIGECEFCGAMAKRGELCKVCADGSREQSSICVVESVLDLMSIEKSGAFRGRYFVLGGKLSPMKRISPENLKMGKLKALVDSGEIKELILALSNDIEAEATCHYIQECIVDGSNVNLTRIGFGLPSGSALLFADSSTIRSALDARKIY